MQYKEYKLIHDEIRTASDSNQLVVFIGAGMSNNFGFPTWNGLVKQMYQELTGKEVSKRKSFSSDDLLRIPQALRSKDKAAYERILRECFGAYRVKEPENAILDEVMKLKPRHIITTNFDTLIEKYLQDKEEALYKEHNAKDGYEKLVKCRVPYHYVPVIRDGDMVSANANHLLLKIHGDVQNMDALVLCEDDYLEYSESHILMENFIKSLLINHTFLFIGYGVGDSNLKLIMKWVDNIVSRQKNNQVRRRKHILLYIENKAMDELQRTYFEQKHIQILDYCRIPSEYRKGEETRFSDARGNHLLCILKSIASGDKEVRVDDRKLEEIFTCFERRKYIHTWELSAWADGETYGLRKLDKELLLWKGSMSSNIIKEIVQRSKRRGNAPSAAKAKSFLERLGAEGYRYTGQNDAYSISAKPGYDFLANACLTNDYAGLYQYVRENKDFSYAEKACWAMYVDNGTDAEKWLVKQWNSKDKMNLFEHLRFAHNLQQVYELEEKYDVDFMLLWKSIPEEEKNRQVLIREYTTDFRDLYYKFGQVSDKLRLQRSIKYSDSMWFTEYEEFTTYRTAILDFVAVLVLNGFYITGLWSYGISHGNISALLYTYVEMILFLLSPQCKRKPEWFELHEWDIFILINMVDKKDLKKLLGKYKITEIDADDDIREILWKNCDNLLDFSIKRISAQKADGHLCAGRMESCMMLMNLPEWKSEELVPLIKKMFVYLTKLTPLDRNARTFSASADVFYSFLKIQYKKEYKELISPYAEDLFKKLIRRFLKEDHSNKYSDVLETNVDWYRDTGLTAQFISQENCQGSKGVIRQCWDCYQKYYRGTVSWLLVDIYPFAEEKVREEIMALTSQRIRGMDIIQLRALLEKGILSYSDEVECVLLDRCQRFSKLTDKQRGKSGSEHSPLTHVLRLWQNGKIPEIEIFHKYKQLDLWFSFVCFPEEFDYSDFDVEGWCTWFDKDTYRGDAFNRNRELLKRKFEQVIEEGADEEVKRIYYKYLE